MSLVTICFSQSLVFVKIVGLGFFMKDKYTFSCMYYVILIENQEGGIEMCYVVIKVSCYFSPLSKSVSLNKYINTREVLGKWFFYCYPLIYSSSTYKRVIYGC